MDLVSIQEKSKSRLNNLDETLVRKGQLKELNDDSRGDIPILSQAKSSLCSNSVRISCGNRRFFQRGS